MNFQSKDRMCFFTTHSAPTPFKDYSASLNMRQVQHTLTQPTVILTTSPQLLIFLDQSIK